MSVITFYTNCKDQTGNTVSSLSYATYLGIIQNKRTLFISTSFNNNEIRMALWPEQKQKKSGLFGPNTNETSVNDNGIEGLDRIIRSNKISPSIISDYTRVALTGRLEILQGYSGSVERYKEIQKQYIQIISLARQIYDTVIIDIDRQLENTIKIEILNMSDIVVAMTTQKRDNINRTIKMVLEGVILKKTNTIITLGKYDEKSKYNAKNISRTFFKSKDLINTVPYNTVLFEETQEGKLIDMFIKFLELKSKDENTFFIDELARLREKIEQKEREIQKNEKIILKL